MTSKHTKGKVRDFELTLEDASRLADCLNSFDDSDSRPGGFTHGNPYTAERVLKLWKKQGNLRVIVAFKDDKIVGHCNVMPGELDPECLLFILRYAPRIRVASGGRYGLDSEAFRVSVARPRVISTP